MPYDFTMPSFKFPLFHLGMSSFTAKGWEKACYPPQTQPHASCPTPPCNLTRWRPTLPSIHACRVSGQELVCEGTSQFPVRSQDAPGNCPRTRARGGGFAHELIPACHGTARRKTGGYPAASYFNKNAFAGLNDFLNRLKPFLENLPAQSRVAPEIRNRHWLGPAFFDLLCKHNIAFARIDLCPTRLGIPERMCILIISYSRQSVTPLWRRHLFEGQMPRNSRRQQNLL